MDKMTVAKTIDPRGLEHNEKKGLVFPNIEELENVKIGYPLLNYEEFITE